MTETSTSVAMRDSETASQALPWPALVLGGAALVLAALFTLTAFA